MFRQCEAHCRSYCKRRADEYPSSARRLNRFMSYSTFLVGKSVKLIRASRRRAVSFRRPRQSRRFTKKCMFKYFLH